MYPSIPFLNHFRLLAQARQGPKRVPHAVPIYSVKVTDVGNPDLIVLFYHIGTPVSSHREHVLTEDNHRDEEPFLEFPIWTTRLPIRLHSPS